jgi:hypothetical protein
MFRGDEFRARAAAGVGLRRPAEPAGCPRRRDLVGWLQRVSALLHGSASKSTPIDMTRLPRLRGGAWPPLVCQRTVQAKLVGVCVFPFGRFTWNPKLVLAPGPRFPL